jgi:hypothetical protein
VPTTYTPSLAVISSSPPCDQFNFRSIVHFPSSSSTPSLLAHLSYFRHPSSPLKWQQTRRQHHQSPSSRQVSKAWADGPTASHSSQTVRKQPQSELCHHNKSMPPSYANQSSRFIRDQEALEADAREALPYVRLTRHSSRQAHPLTLALEY